MKVAYYIALILAVAAVVASSLVDGLKWMFWVGLGLLVIAFLFSPRLRRMTDRRHGDGA